mgnify:CR=1 FL=1|jgi:hypothetical protein
MSSADLRGSLRAALAFQPTYRPRKQTQNLPTPYLDRISVTEHRGSPKSNRPKASRITNDGLPDSTAWKKLIIRPIGVPDLKHTKINTVFEPEQVPFTAPSGKILKGLRTTLQRGYIDAVKSANAELEATRKERFERERQYDDRHEADNAPTQTHLFDREKYDATRAYDALESEDSTTSLRSEASYTAPPKFEAFLDFVYGPSNLTGSYPRNYNAQMKEYLPVPRK